MPLLKLWNSIRGQSTKGQSAEDRAAKKPPAAIAVSPRSGFSLFGGGPHAGLCKLVKRITACSVLEISVEDGSRAIAVLQTLAKREQNVRYLAIDQFEMAGGVTLKQFHQTLRAQNIRPRLFPETIERGLIRVAHTVGTVDLVLIAAPQRAWRSARVLQLLARVSHANTVVLYCEGDTWIQYQTTPASSQRAA